MDDLYAINAAKTEFREGFNLADASRILAIADPDLVNFSDGQPSEFGETGWMP
jgi:ketosteroid isomerase-like protein